MEKYITINDIKSFLLKNGIVWNAKTWGSKKGSFTLVDADVTIKDVECIPFGVCTPIGKDEPKAYTDFVCLEVTDTTFKMWDVIDKSKVQDFSKDWVKYLLKNHSEYAEFLEVKAKQMKIEIKKNAEEKAKPIIEKLNEIHKQEQENLQYCQDLIDMAIAHSFVTSFQK